MKRYSTDDKIWDIGLLLCAIAIGGCSLFTSSSKEEAIEIAGDSAYIKQNLTYAADKLKQKDYAIKIEELNSTCTEASIDQQPLEEQELFDYVTDPELSEEQAHHYSLIWNRFYTAEVAIIRLATYADSLLRNGKDIQLNLPYEQYLTVTNERITHNESGSTSWSGSIQNIHGSVVLVYEKGDITGTINPGAANDCSILTYKMSPIGGGLNALYRINQNTGIHLID